MGIFKRKKVWIKPAGTIPGIGYNVLKQPHAIIAGATGSGKSVVIDTIIYSLMYSAPCEKKLVLIDPKRVQLSIYKKIPHTLNYASEPEQIYNALLSCVNEMENRFKYMQKHSLRLYDGYDIYIIIDEYADLITTDKKRVQPLCARIAQLGRAAKIHLIVATQRPTRDIIDGQIKCNIDCRVALRCPTKQDSRNIINVGGAELLPRYGKGYYLTPETMQPWLIDIPMIDDSTINDMVKYWTKQK